MNFENDDLYSQFSELGNRDEERQQRREDARIALLQDHSIDSDELSEPIYSDDDLVNDYEEAKANAPPTRLFDRVQDDDEVSDDIPNRQYNLKNLSKYERALLADDIAAYDLRQARKKRRRAKIQEKRNKKARRSPTDAIYYSTDSEDVSDDDADVDGTKKIRNDGNSSGNNSGDEVYEPYDSDEHDLDDSDDSEEFDEDDDPNDEIYNPDPNEFVGLLREWNCKGPKRILKDHQINATYWASEQAEPIIQNDEEEYVNNGMFLYHSTGSGKTLTALSLMNEIIKKDNKMHTWYVIVPRGLLRQWEDNVFIENLCTIYPSLDDLWQDYKTFEKIKFVTLYQFANLTIEDIKDSYLLIDEAHQYRYTNNKAKLSRLKPKSPYKQKANATTRDMQKIKDKMQDDILSRMAQQEQSEVDENVDDSLLKRGGNSEEVDVENKQSIWYKSQFTKKVFLMSATPLFLHPLEMASYKFMLTRKKNGDTLEKDKVIEKVEELALDIQVAVTHLLRSSTNNVNNKEYLSRLATTTSDADNEYCPPDESLKMFINHIQRFWDCLFHVHIGVKDETKPVINAIPETTNSTEHTWIGTRGRFRSLRSSLLDPDLDKDAKPNEPFHVFVKLQPEKAVKWSNDPGRYKNAYSDQYNHYLNSNEKLERMLELVNKHLEKSNQAKVMIYSRFVKYGLNRIQAYLNKNNVPCLKLTSDYTLSQNRKISEFCQGKLKQTVLKNDLDGINTIGEESMTKKGKEKSVQDAATKEQEKDVRVILVPEGLGTGLNLENVTALILFEPSWCAPQTYQIVSRVARHNGHPLITDLKLKNRIEAYLLIAHVQASDKIAKSNEKANQDLFNTEMMEADGGFEDDFKAWKTNFTADEWTVFRSNFRALRGQHYLNIVQDGRINTKRCKKNLL